MSAKNKTSKDKTPKVVANCQVGFVFGGIFKVKVICIFKYSTPLEVSVADLVREFGADVHARYIPTDAPDVVFDKFERILSERKDCVQATRYYKNITVTEAVGLLRTVGNAKTACHIGSPKRKKTDDTDAADDATDAVSDEDVAPEKQPKKSSKKVDSNEPVPIPLSKVSKTGIVEDKSDSDEQVSTKAPAAPQKVAIPVAKDAKLVGNALVTAARNKAAKESSDDETVSPKKATSPKKKPTKESSDDETVSPRKATSPKKKPTKDASDDESDAKKKLVVEKKKVNAADTETNVDVKKKSTVAVEKKLDTTDKKMDTVDKKHVTVPDKKQPNTVKKTTHIIDADDVSSDAESGDESESD
jgi:hypothetical protein